MAMSLEEKRRRDAKRGRDKREREKAERPCATCGKVFLYRRSKKKYCSRACYKENHRVYIKNWSEERHRNDPTYRPRLSRLETLRRHNLTPAEYEAEYVGQDGKCAICKTRPIQHIDHDHQTDSYRGLLCGNCNRGLGQFKDDDNVLIAAAEYIRKFRERS